MHCFGGALVSIPLRFSFATILTPETKSLVSRKLPAVSREELRMIGGWHRLWLELGRYLIAFEPLTFVLD